MSMNLKTVSKRRTCFGLSDDPRNVESTPAYAVKTFQKQKNTVWLRCVTQDQKALCFTKAKYSELECGQNV